jgi:uncharacterized protein involved in outer membrane biogenesis
MKKLLWAVVLLVLVAGVGYALLVTFYSPEAQRAELERRLSAAFGRPAHVGPMRLTLAGGLGVEADQVRVERDPSFGEGSLVEIDRVRADIGVWDWIVHRRPAIDTLVLERPRLVLVQREDGVWNFTTLGGAGAAVASAPAGGPALAAARVAWLAQAVSGASVMPGRIEATDAEVTILNRTVSPATEAVYRGLALSTDVAPEGAGYRVRGRTWGDSEAAGGEPLSADVAFDLALTPPGEAPVWQAQGTVPSGRLATRNLRLDGVAAGVALDREQTLRFEPLTLTLYGGTLEGRFVLDLAQRGNRFGASGTVARVALGDALAPRADLAGALHGNASGNFDVTGELGDFNSTLATTAGTGRLVLENAELRSINLLAEITRQGGFEGVRFDEQGTRADRIEADLRIEKGRVYFERGNVQNINGYANVRADSGWIDLGTPASIELVGAATLLPPLFQKIAAANPAAAVAAQFVLAGQPIVIPLVVRGPIDRPAVQVRWGATLGLPFGF